MRCFLNIISLHMKFIRGRGSVDCYSLLKLTAALTSQMLWPLVTTNSSGIRQRIASLWFHEWCGLGLQQTLMWIDSLWLFKFCGHWPQQTMIAKLFLCYSESCGSQIRWSSMSWSCSSNDSRSSNRISNSSSSSRRGIRVYCSQRSHNLKSHRDSWPELPQFIGVRSHNILHITERLIVSRD